jgi:hypothetical protein
MKIAISHSFLEAALVMSPADTRRAAVFLDKLLHSTALAGLRLERVHDATEDTPVRLCTDSRTLCSVLETAGVDHGLTRLTT